MKRASPTPRKPSVKRRTDSERLDWLERNRALLNHPPGYKPHVCVGGGRFESGEHYHAPSYREVIDKAMEEFSNGR